MYKISMDVLTLDGLGFLRDAVGVIGPAIGAVADSISEAVGDYDVPANENQIA